MTKREESQEMFEGVYALMRDGRFREAASRAEEAMMVYQGIPDPVLKDAPICVACEGLAEIVNPYDDARKARCEDTPRLCHGNRYGRMSPEQLIAYCALRAEELAARQAENRSPEQRELDEATYREMQQNAMGKVREPGPTVADPPPFDASGGDGGGAGVPTTVPADPPVEEPQPTPPTPA